jgi:hypothetical protein
LSFLLAFFFFKLALYQGVFVFDRRCNSPTTCNNPTRITDIPDGTAHKTRAGSMAFLFGRSKARSNQELTRSTKDLILKLIAEDKPSQKVSDHYDPSELDWADDGQIEEEVARNLGQMKVILQGTPGMQQSS